MFSKIEDAIKAIARGEMVVVVDNADRENEGDIIFSAQHSTPEKINFLTKYARGLICVSLEESRVDQLQLPMMVTRNTERFQTAFTVSVEAREGTTTGISAQDRSLTAQFLADYSKGARDFISPGHIFPLQARNGGVLVRAGHTEAAVDLMKLAHLPPAGVICEILNEDGTMARLPDLTEFSQKHHLHLISIADLITYRRQGEKLVRKVANPKMPTEYGLFQAVAYEDIIHGGEHLALVKGEISQNQPILVRVHSECLTGDAFGSLRCDCGTQLHFAMDKIASEGGVLLYMRQEGRGIGLHNKMRAYELQDQGMDTIEANEHLGFKSDARTYGIGAQILYDLGCREIRLLTNNPKKKLDLDGFGLKVVEQIPIFSEPTYENRHYLFTKRAKMGHTLPNLDSFE